MDRCQALLSDGWSFSSQVIGEITSHVGILNPLLSAALLYWAFRGANKLLGPVERMIRELDQRLEGRQAARLYCAPAIN